MTTIFAFVLTVDMRHTCPSRVAHALVDGAIKAAVAVLLVCTGAHVCSHEGTKPAEQTGPRVVSPRSLKVFFSLSQDKMGRKSFHVNVVR